MQALTAVRPQLVAVQTAAQALGLQRHQLLHAGPPLRDARRPPAAMASAIVMTCLHERWAADAAQAEALLRDGVLQLSPAQDRGCVTPLVAVVSAGTPLFEVTDAAGGPGRLWAPVSAVRGADTRMGTRDPELPARLQRRDQVLVPALQQALARHGPIALWPLAAAGLAAGDDLHSRTAAANAAWATLLHARDAVDAAADITATPLFFLTLWMAASALLLRAAEGGSLPTLVTRAGGNGEVFGIALAGRPQQWFSCPADAPSGQRLPHLAADIAITGAVGDSAVIDLLGLGGQRLALAPEPLAVFQPTLAGQGADVLLARARSLLQAPQPLLADAWPLGIDAAQVVQLQTAPLVMLAMLAADGSTGFAGRGVYTPPLALFNAALQALRPAADAAS